MANLELLVIVACVIGTSVTATPVPEDVHIKANAKPLNATVDENEVEDYFKHLDTDLMLGEPDFEVGVKVSQWTPDSGVSPEELGEYFQGDILIPASEVRNAIPTSSSRWPNAVVPFVIDGTFSKSELAMIQNAIEQFHQRTCVKFRTRTTERDYVKIGNSDSGCWASAGRIGGMQKVNLQSPSCLWWRGTVMHELNHALGFLHEQSRPERDNWVNIYWDNIVEGMKFNFNKHSPSLTGLGIEYDYSSMMHYTPKAFSKNNQETIAAKRQMKKGQVMGQRDGFSDQDVWKINRLYNCEGYEGWATYSSG